LKRGYDVVVVGGGPAGLAAGVKARMLGLSVLLLEDSDTLGGIPLQCIHPGFGLHCYGEDLTGPEFSHRLIGSAEEVGVNHILNAYVSGMAAFPNNRRITLRVISPDGAFKFHASTVIYAAGAREKHIFEAGIVGDRVSGLYTAGEAQALMDLYGVMPGREIVVVGSGDVGLIMARRFALEGAHVKGVVELLPYPGGLTRNIVQCLEDYGIPLLLSHKVAEVKGERRVEKAIIVKVDERLRIIPGTEREVKCDTVILAVGLVPYIKPLRDLGVEVDPSTGGPMVNGFLETSIPGIFTCGNALAINDLADYAVEQGGQAALGAYNFIKNRGIPEAWKSVGKGRNVKLAIPHYISRGRDAIIYVRVKKPERNVKLHIPEIDWEMKLPSVKPAEMIRVRLDAEDLLKIIDGLTIEVIPDTCRR
jgi:thioredoxin reductase